MRSAELAKGLPRRVQFQGLGISTAEVLPAYSKTRATWSRGSLMFAIYDIYAYLRIFTLVAEKLLSYRPAVRRCSGNVRQNEDFDLF